MPVERTLSKRTNLRVFRLDFHFPARLFSGLRKTKTKNGNEPVHSFASQSFLNRACYCYRIVSSIFFVDIRKTGIHVRFDSSQVANLIM